MPSNAHPPVQEGPVHEQLSACHLLIQRMLLLTYNDEHGVKHFAHPPIQEGPVHEQLCWRGYCTSNLSLFVWSQWFSALQLPLASSNCAVAYGFFMMMMPANAHPPVQAMHTHPYRKAQSMRSCAAATSTPGKGGLLSRRSRYFMALLLTSWSCTACLLLRHRVCSAWEQQWHTHKQFYQ